MAKEIVNLGTSPNSRDGDVLRVAFDKINNNFTELYEIYNNPAITLVTVPTTSVGLPGDQPGFAAADNTYFYFCVDNYDGSSHIWKRITWLGDTW